MRKRSKREDVTARYKAGSFDDDDDPSRSIQRFSNRSKTAEGDKIQRTANLRAEDAVSEADLATLPAGEVVQVFSLFYEVEHDGKTYRCTARKTLQKLAETGIVVGDRVKFREDVIEQILPRETILTRAGRTRQHPIVANAQQMLIVASIVNPTVKWGLVDRMIIAAQSGKLQPIVCLNKIDLGAEEMPSADEVLAHYGTLGVTTIKASAENGEGLDPLRDILKNRATVLSGHSGVGKSSLIRSIQPQLDLRIGEVSSYTDKGRHTTTSARRYTLDFGGAVIDTPGVKMFGLWGVSRENLIEYFPDVDADAAPKWRQESYERIAASLPS